MPSFNDIMAARKAISGYIYETPIIYSNALRQRTGHEEVVLKCENLQRTGSYHIRGVMYHIIRQKENDLGINHFVTHSTGNHGQAVALAASSFDSAAHIVVPEGTNPRIVSGIRHYGGEVYFCRPHQSDRLRLVQDIMIDNSKTEKKKVNTCLFVHPYDDDYIIAGHGTCGVELMLQTDGKLDCVVCPVGGGALISGVAMAVKGMRPNIAVFAAEPLEVDDTYQSFKRGELVVDKRSTTNNNDNNSSNTIAEGLGAPLTPRTFNYIQKYVDGVLKVTESEIQYAFRYIYERCKLVVDANAATAVAAVLSRPDKLSKYKRVGIILGGGNIDLEDIPKLAASHL